VGSSTLTYFTQRAKKFAQRRQFY